MRVGGVGRHALSRAADAADARRRGRARLHGQAMWISYKGFMLKPVAADDPCGSASMLIVTGPDGAQRASGVLGYFADSDEACRYAIEHGIAEIDQLGSGF
jgi:hypothetical protein